MPGLALALVCSALFATSIASADVATASREAQALDAAREAASGCLVLMDHDADEFLDCIEYRAAAQAEPAARLGVLWYGWLLADIHDAHALDGAEAAARKLFAEAEPLRLGLGIDRKTLCVLVDLPCAEQQARSRARAASTPS